MFEFWVELRKTDLVGQKLNAIKNKKRKKERRGEKKGRRISRSSRLECNKGIFIKSAGNPRYIYTY